MTAIKLISCDTCGVVLNEGKIKFPQSIYKDLTYEIDCTKIAYIEGEFVLKAHCPVCGGEIYKIA